MGPFTKDSSSHKQQNMIIIIKMVITKDKVRHHLHIQVVKRI